MLPWKRPPVHANQPVGTEVAELYACIVPTGNTIFEVTTLTLASSFICEISELYWVQPSATPFLLNNESSLGLLVGTVYVLFPSCMSVPIFISFDAFNGAVEAMLESVLS